MSDTATVRRADQTYPPLLAEIAQPPQTLYVRGSLEALAAPCLAVVGTRTPSAYGKQITPMLVSGLTRAGITIVSGLAIGIDTLAHEAALESGGKTVAVLGSGVDEISVYPPENRTLARRIVEAGGAVISEFPEGTEPKPFHFPQRNRIIAGLSRGVLVIEAREKSGALITANFALEENRDVFAVPGPITIPTSAGPNRLIAAGAQAILSADDILDAWHLAELPLPAHMNRPDAPLLAYFPVTPIHVDELVRSSGLSAAEVNVELAKLELAGYIRNLGGGAYTKT
ncbi:DNA-protecting protein DprA [Candidatus Parcubacteria bacterium]|nr:DNA-protecting protein DprA [Candidatus Parcubacteria bacterium]MBI4098915.1 DNA-protecting protein DprA [Candidatus Parcubacteria bacterium]MBI4385486.1 DNA-protecting protein DprA [Candidatus Parcubacteria bacterium]